MWAKESTKNDIELTICTFLTLILKLYFYRSYFPFLRSKGATKNNVEWTICTFPTLTNNIFVQELFPLHVGKKGLLSHKVQ